MKVPMIVQAAALCAIASAPTQAYVISYNTWKLDERTSTRRDFGPEARTTANRNAGSGPAAAAPSQNTKLNATNSRPSQSQHDTTSVNFVAISASNPNLGTALSQASKANSWLADFNNEKSPSIRTFARGNALPYGQTLQRQTLPIATSEMNHTDILLVELQHANEDFFSGTATTDAFWRDQIHDASWSDNNVTQPKATVRTGVPEPASLGMIALGLSALVLSRRKARHCTA